MKRSLAQYFAQYAEIVADGHDLPHLPEYDSDIIPESELKPILDEIFAVDPITGNPRGDVAYFLSKDGNPQVKAFVESALLAERPAVGMSDSDKIDDDLIVEYSRKDNESVGDYALRLSKYRDDALKAYEKAKFELENPNPE